MTWEPWRRAPRVLVDDLYLRASRDLRATIVAMQAVLDARAEANLRAAESARTIVGAGGYMHDAED